MAKNPHADFSPTLLGYTGQGAFRFWCQMALPLTYDDSLSYYELLNKVVTYLNNTIEDVANVETNVDALSNAYNQLQKYVNDYFDDLDVEEELRNVLDKMALDGSLDAILTPMVEAALPDIVDDKIDDVVADQIDEVVAEQISGVVENQLPPLVDENVPDAVSDWLEENVDPVGSAVVVDTTLSIGGAAADAKVTGNEIGDLKSQLNEISSPGENLGYISEFDGTKTASGVSCQFIDKRTIKVWGTGTGWIRFNILRGNTEMVSGSPTFSNNLPAGIYTPKFPDGTVQLYYGTNWNDRTRWYTGEPKTFVESTMIWLSSMTNSQSFGTELNPTIVEFELYAGNVSTSPTAIDVIARNDADRANKLLDEISEPGKNIGYFSKFYGTKIDGLSRCEYIDESNIMLYGSNGAETVKLNLLRGNAEFTSSTPTFNQNINAGTYTVECSGADVYYGTTWNSRTQWENRTSHTFDASNCVWLLVPGGDYGTKEDPTIVNFKLYSGNVNIEPTAIDKTARKTLIRKKNGYDNNLVNDEIPHDWLIYKNGTASLSNYGVDNVRYVIPKNHSEKSHIAFDFRFNAPIEVLGHVPLFSAFGDAVNVGLNHNQGWRFLNNYIDKMRNIQFSNAGQSTYSFNDLSLKGFQGSFAFSVQYTGDKANNMDIVCTITDGVLTVKHSTDDTVIGSVTFNSNDTVEDLVDFINTEISDVEAVVYQTTGHTCADLLVSASPVPSNQVIKMVNSFTGGYSGETVIDAPKIYIPYKYDDSWHTFEACIDETNLMVYASIDGITARQAIDSTYLNIGEQSVVLGGIFSDTEVPITIRNLHIDYEGYGEAEIVTSVAPGATGEFNQMISDRNPRLLIYEGHGIVVGTDSDIPASDQGLSASTDRLRYLFGYLESKGYKPVTWQQIVMWKKNGIPLPKRCYNIMFDDFRFANYVDYDKREPFIRYGVKAGLAVITGRDHTLDSEETINGKTYTAKEMIAMVNRAGWYPCSHTAEHYHIYDYANDELYAKIKNDVLTADEWDIYSNILVYPFGSYNIRYRAAYETSGFAVGVDVVSKRYNCRGINDFQLTRVEAGSRVSLENLVVPIV